MTLKKDLENRIRGWIPKEPHPSNSTMTFQASLRWSKVLTFSIIFGVLAVIIALTVFYLPFIQQQTFGFTALLLIVIANIVAAYLVRKGVLPKPTNSARMRNLAILAVNLAILFLVVIVIRLLFGGL
ncbi:MAG: hypothetical protein ACQCN4_02825 [Candidatus Bathyarchaeia archaeon]|jgi:hypothetical protein